MVNHTTVKDPEIGGWLIAPYGGELVNLLMQDEESEELTHRATELNRCNCLPAHCAIWSFVHRSVFAVRPVYGPSGLHGGARGNAPARGNAVSDPDNSAGA